MNILVVVFQIWIFIAEYCVLKQTLYTTYSCIMSRL